MNIASWILKIIYSVISFFSSVISTLQSVIDEFLPLLNFVTLLVAVAVLIVAMRTLRRVQRLTRSSESRANFLRDQQERWELLHEEHRLLVERLEGGSQTSLEHQQKDEQASR